MSSQEVRIGRGEVRQGKVKIDSFQIQKPQILHQQHFLDFLKHLIIRNAQILSKYTFTQKFYQQQSPDIFERGKSRDNAV